MKDIVKAASTANNSSSKRQLNVPANVSAEGIKNVLQNIGMGDRMSRSEIEGIISEVGDSDGGESNGCVVISENQMLDLISGNWEDHHHGLNQPGH